MSRRLVLLLALGVPAVAGAAPSDEALACVRTKAWEARAEGWSVKALRGVDLGAGDHVSSAITLFPGRSYRVVSCGTAGVSDLDLVLYDAEGRAVLRDATADRQPVLDLGERPGTYVLAAHARAASPGTHGVAVAVLHR